MRRFMLALLLLLMGPKIARAHLVAGRRPFDVLLAKSVAAGFATVERGTSVPAAGEAGGRTTFRMVECLRGPCPRGRFTAQPVDDHGAEFHEGPPVFLLLTREPNAQSGNRSPTWRILITEWEGRTLATADPADLRTFTRRFGAVLAMPAASRAAAYIDVLLDQLAAAPQWLQEDALQSLLRVPATVTPVQVDRLLQAAAATRFENIRLGVFLVAEGWNGAALRRYLMTAPLDAWEPAVRARALYFLAAGDGAERAEPCRYLSAQEDAVRAAAVGACTPPHGNWTPLAMQGLADPSPEVKRSAKERLGAHPEVRGDVRALVLADLPWWRRWYYRATGGEPAVVSEIFTPAGASKP